MPIDLYSSSINYRRDLIIAVSDHGKGSDVLRIHEEKPGHYGVRECMNARATLAPAYRLRVFPTEELRSHCESLGVSHIRIRSVVRIFRKMIDFAVQPLSVRRLVQESIE
jgi:hypothetical protein